MKASSLKQSARSAMVHRFALAAVVVWAAAACGGQIDAQPALHQGDIAVVLSSEDCASRLGDVRVIMAELPVTAIVLLADAHPNEFEIAQLGVLAARRGARVTTIESESFNVLAKRTKTPALVVFGRDAAPTVYSLVASRRSILRVVAEIKIRAQLAQLALPRPIVPEDPSAPGLD